MVNRLFNCVTGIVWVLSALRSLVTDYVGKNAAGNVVDVSFNLLALWAKLSGMKRLLDLF